MLCNPSLPQTRVGRDLGTWCSHQPFTLFLLGNTWAFVGVPHWDLEKSGSVGAPRSHGDSGKVIKMVRVMARNSGIQVAPVNPQKFCIRLPDNSPGAVVLSPGLLEFEFC